MPAKVAIAGATGNVGPAVLDQLSQAGFELTVLTRKDSNSNVHKGAKVVKVDYESLDDLKQALSGHDVVVSTLNVGAVPRDIHIRLVDAAAAAGVKRFIPSEYGADTTNSKAANLPVFADKLAVQEHLKKSGLTYSLLYTGPFLDWGIKVGFLLDLSSPVTTLYDNGENKFSTTTLADVGRGIVGIINNLDDTKNKPVYVSSATVTQKQLLELSGKKVETKNVATTDLEKEGYEELKKQSPNPQIVATRFLFRAIFGDGFGTHFDSSKLSNKEFGIKELSDNEIKGFFN